MNYSEARKFVEETTKYGSILGLDTIKTLLGELGNPQDKVKIVHVAGNKRKRFSFYICTECAFTGRVSCWQICFSGSI